MIAQIFKSVATKNRVPILSYVEEASMSTAACIGLAFAISGLQKLVLPIDPLQTITESAFHGSLVVTAGYALPVAANYIDQTLRDRLPDVIDLFEVHHHKPSRLAGLATGAILSLSLCWSAIGAPGTGPSIPISPLVQKAEEIAKIIGESQATRYPQLEMAVIQQP